MSRRTLWPLAGGLLVLSLSALAGRVMVYDTAKPASTAAPVVKQAPESKTKSADADVDGDEDTGDEKASEEQSKDGDAAPAGDGAGAPKKSKPADDKQALLEREERMKALQEVTVLLGPEVSLGELLGDDVKKKS